MNTISEYLYDLEEQLSTCFDNSNYMSEIVRRAKLELIKDIIKYYENLPE